MNRDFKGIWIPKEVWLTDKLTMQEKIFFVEISSLDNEKGCFAGNAYFADFFRISKTRVSLIIKSLIEKGFIKSEIIYKNGTQQILNRVLKECYRPYITKVKDPTLQKLKDNNTTNNTTNNKEIVEPISNHSLNQKKKVMFTDEDMGLAVTMFHNILAMNENFKKPDLEKWANEFRLMREIDLRKVEGMDNFLNSLASSSDKMWEFWRGNILSPKSMRKNYDKVVSQYRKDVVDKKKVVNQDIPLNERMSALANRKGAQL